MYLVDSDNDEVAPNTVIYDFRDTAWKFLRISQSPRIDSQGKIQVKGTVGIREFYPSVFDCRIMDWS